MTKNQTITAEKLSNSTFFEIVIVLSYIRQYVN